MPEPGSGILPRRRGRQGRTPHPPRGHSEALRRHVQGADRRRLCAFSRCWERMRHSAHHQGRRLSRSQPSIGSSTKPPATSSRRTSPSTRYRGAFAGNEIDRVQVYAFAMHMQALAMVADGSGYGPEPSRAYRASAPAPVCRARRHGMVPFGSGNTSRGVKARMASSLKTICASWSSKRTSTVHAATTSSCATNAGYSCPRVASPAWTGRYATPRPKRCF